MKSGASAQIGYGEESPWGTRAAPTVFVPLLEESFEEERERLESEGIIPGLTVLGSDQWNGGAITAGGDVGHELYTEGLDLLLKHMFGTVATTGDDPYTHLYTPVGGSIDGKGLTAQVGRPGVGGTVHPFDLVGSKVSEWEIACSQSEIATLGLTLVGRELVTNQTLATPTYTAAGSKPFKFNHGAVEVGGSEVKVMEAKVSGSNGLKEDRRFLSRTDDGRIAEPLEETLREYTGELTVEFESMTHYARFVAGTEHALELSFVAGAASFTVNGNIRYDGAPVGVGGREVLEQTLPVKFIRSGSTDSTAISVTTVNTVETV